MNLDASGDTDGIHPGWCCDKCERAGKTYYTMQLECGGGHCADFRRVWVRREGTGWVTSEPPVDPNREVRLEWGNDANAGDRYYGWVCNCKKMFGKEELMNMHQSMSKDCRANRMHSRAWIRVEKMTKVGRVNGWSRVDNGLTVSDFSNVALLQQG